MPTYDSYTNYLKDLATALAASLAGIPGIKSVVQGYVPSYPYLAEVGDSVAFYSFAGESGDYNAVQVCNVMWRAKVGIMCLSDKPDGDWLAQNACKLKDWFESIWFASPKLSGKCNGLKLINRFVNDGQKPYVYYIIDFIF